MKAFRNSQGRLSGQTMTVGELREALAEYPNDLPVFAEWESVLGFVKRENFLVRPAHKGNPAETCDCLLIDVENY